MSDWKPDPKIVKFLKKIAKKRTMSLLEFMIKEIEAGTEVGRDFHERIVLLRNDLGEILDELARKNKKP